MLPCSCAELEVYNQAGRRNAKTHFLGPEAGQWGGRLPQEGWGSQSWFPSSKVHSLLSTARQMKFCSGDVSDIFYFFSPSGEGKGVPEAPGRGGGGAIFLWKIPGGGSPGGWGGGARGREGVCGEFGGGGG